MAAGPAEAFPHSGVASPMASVGGTDAAGFGQTTSASTNVAGAQIAGLLGPVIGVVGQAVTAAVTGVVEAVVSAQSGASVPMPVETAGSAEPVGPASITLGDNTIEVKAGADGVSVSLTVRESGSAPDVHTLDVGSDGNVELRGTGGPEMAEPAEVVTAPAPAATPGPGASDAPSAGQVESEPAPDPEPSDIEDCPPQVAAEPEGVQSNPVPHPHPAGTSNDRGAQVAPQSSAPEESPPPADGVLALAGDQ